MKPSPSRFGIGRALEARERRTIAAGATLVALAAVVVLLVLPFLRHWTEREAIIAATRERLGRLMAIAGREAEISARAHDRDARLDAGGPRVIRARTPALASSELQSVIQEYARASRVSVARLDVAGAPAAAGAGAATVAVPATVSAVGDIYGVTEFLRRLQHGPRLLEITTLALSPNPTLRGNLLQMSVTVRAPIASED
jgi:hypothetical protein